MKGLNSSGAYSKCSERIKELNHIVNQNIYNAKCEKELRKLHKQKKKYEQKHNLPKPKYFTDKGFLSNFSGTQAREATSIALDTRKFEIELYWKRANYFWAFIATIFAAYFLLIAYNTGGWFIHSAVCLIGICFSFGWYLANRGSKYWQENWEAHIGVLSTKTIGDIFKHWLRPNDRFRKLNGAYPISVSKINQFLSLVTFFIWVLLYIKSIFNWFVLKPIKDPIVSFLNSMYSKCNPLFFAIIILFSLLTIMILVLWWMFKFSKNTSSLNIKEHLKEKHEKHPFIRFDNK